MRSTTASIQAYNPSPAIGDYAGTCWFVAPPVFLDLIRVLLCVATKAAIVNFTKCYAKELMTRYVSFFGRAPALRTLTGLFLVRLSRHGIRVNWYIQPNLRICCRDNPNGVCSRVLLGVSVAPGPVWTPLTMQSWSKVRLRCTLSFALGIDL